MESLRRRGCLWILLIDRVALATADYPGSSKSNRTPMSRIISLVPRLEAVTHPGLGHNVAWSALVGFELFA
jgi:hypothetical protein